MKQYNKRNHSFEKFTHYKNKSQYFFYNQPLFSASLFNVPIHLRSYICPLLSVLTCIGHAASQTDQSFDGHGLCISQPTLCKFLLLLFNFFWPPLVSSSILFFFVLIQVQKLSPSLVGYCGILSQQQLGQLAMTFSCSSMMKSLLIGPRPLPCFYQFINASEHVDIQSPFY